MSKMQPDLLALLKENEVHGDIIEWMENNDCGSLKRFANFVDDRGQLGAAIVDQTSQKGSRAQTAAVKQAWREAEALVVRLLKRSSEGLSEEHLDEPLNAELYRSMEDTFKKFYNWELTPQTVGCDSLCGRIRREFERRQPSMFAIMRVRSMASAQKVRPIY